MRTFNFTGCGDGAAGVFTIFVTFKLTALVHGLVMLNRSRSCPVEIVALREAMPAKW
jgi:hypothetical protein